MDSVHKSWGFRTSPDPFQENSSQRLEGNKGRKLTPLRKGVGSLEREDSSLNQGFAIPNGRHNLRGEVIHHSVRAHLCLRLSAGTQICSQLSREGKLLDPMVWSNLHLHVEPVERF